MSIAIIDWHISSNQWWVAFKTISSNVLLNNIFIAETEIWKRKKINRRKKNNSFNVGWNQLRIEKHTKKKKWTAKFSSASQPNEHTGFVYISTLVISYN